MDALEAGEVLAVEVEGGVLELGPGAGDEDLVTVCVSTGGVVATVRDPE